MSHNDYISQPPAAFEVIAHTPKCPCAAMADEKRKLYAVQFHPEVTHTDFGRQIIANFLFGVCRLKADWRTESVVGAAVGAYGRARSGTRGWGARAGGGEGPAGTGHHRSALTLSSLYP